ncbi:Holliday junction resolvase RuvX [Alkanindiges sp. WGS2144]|uniref:Holliday junction resolvase RuvX n=1 Tax=Alkanindiges sp. WGS2144 TaxID=3366808 RepID=UPI0037528C75
MTNLPNQPQTIMAFDFGTQKMGMATGNELLGTAQPLDLFPMRDGIPDWDKLEKIIANWQPDLCLVGLPLNMDDTESELSLRARKFARRLKYRLNKPVWMIDERLTTRDARYALEDYKKHGHGKKTSADSLAAAMLVESWFREPYGILP